MTASDLRTFRLSLGLSQAEMARALGYSGPHMRQTVHRYETGIRPIPERVELRVDKLRREGLPANNG